MNTNNRRFYTFKDWAKEMKDPSESGLRWMHHTNKDGFSDFCVLKRGKRVLIDSEAYTKWLLKINNKN